MVTSTRKFTLEEYLVYDDGIDTRYEAAQQLNEHEQLVIFGIISNGSRWQFGKPGKSQFTLNKIFYTIQELDHLFAAVNFVFQQCDHQLNTRVTA